MTLDEAIKHAEEVAELHENRCKFYTEHDMPECEPPSMKCAEEHRQLAEWLKELKAYKEQSGDEELDFVPEHKKIPCTMTIGKPCDDAISRQAVLNGLASIAKVKARSDAQKSLMGRVMFFVEHLSSVTPQPKTGRWIVNEWGNISCSECGCTAPYDKVYPGESVFGKAIRVKSTFCPTCGAKMKGGKK